MQLKIKFYHLLLFGAIATSSCKKDYVRPAPVVPPPVGVKFSTDIVPIFTANCSMSGCHEGSSHPLNLTPSNAYASLFAFNQIDTTNLPSSAANSALYVRMTNAGSPMPPSGLLPSSETAKVLSWIQDGAKNN